MSPFSASIIPAARGCARRYPARTRREPRPAPPRLPYIAGARRATAGVVEGVGVSPGWQCHRRCRASLTVLLFLSALFFGRGFRAAHTYTGARFVARAN